MEVNNDIQSQRGGVGHHVVRPGKNFVRQFEIGRRPGVMMPANGQSDMVKALGADLLQIKDRVRNGPMFARWHFQVIGDIDPAHEAFGRQMGRRVAAGDALHGRQIVLRGCRQGKEQQKNQLANNFHAGMITGAVLMSKELSPRPGAVSGS